jgi:DNA-binding transcriptional LysR family regulator
VRLTDAGTQYLEDVRRIVAEIEEAEQAAAGSHSAPRGTLAITAPVLFGQLFVMPILLEFLKNHAQLSANVLLVDRVVNLAEEGFDVALRIGELPDSSMIGIRVGNVRRIVVGAPAYFAKEGIPTNPRELADRRMIMTTSASASREWRFREQHKPLAIRVQPSLTVNLNQTAIIAAVRGQGMTQVLSYQVAAELSDGRLQIALSEYELSSLPVHVVYPEARKASAKVRSVASFLAEHLRKEPAIN